jgi:hypothetical protein
MWIIAKNVLRRAVSEQRSKRAATTKGVTNVISVAARDPEMLVSALIRIDSLTEQWRTNDGRYEDRRQTINFGFEHIAVKLWNLC